MMSFALRRPFVLASLLALLASGCIFLTRFDPEGQPCDPDSIDRQCLKGYVCRDGKCVSDGSADAGP